MSYEYNRYLANHKANVIKGFSWLCDNIFKDNKNAHTAKSIEAASIILENHDDSKYSLAEYEPYDVYFYGDKKDEQTLNAFNKAWLHHIHQNKHHWQHWVLVNDDPELGTVAIEMPLEYVIEMICDWWSFSWKSEDLYEIFSWYEKNKNHIILHENTRKVVESILKMMRKKLDEDKK